MQFIHQYLQPHVQILPLNVKNTPDFKIFNFIPNQEGIEAIKETSTLFNPQMFKFPVILLLIELFAQKDIFDLLSLNERLHNGNYLCANRLMKVLTFVVYFSTYLRSLINYGTRVLFSN